MAVATIGHIPAGRARGNGTQHEHGGRDVQYLDLDGDGIPDAVRITETRVLQWASDGREEVVQVTSELATGIGDDGAPAKVETTDALEILAGSHDRGVATTMAEHAFPSSQ